MRFRKYILKGKVTNIAEFKYELSVQLQYEQYYAEIKGKLPIFEEKWSRAVVLVKWLARLPSAQIPGGGAEKENLFPCCFPVLRRAL